MYTTNKILFYSKVFSIFYYTNSKVMAEPKWDSPKTKELFARGCADCHSNETFGEEKEEHDD